MRMTNKKISMWIHFMKSNMTCVAYLHYIEDAFTPLTGGHGAAYIKMQSMNLSKDFEGIFAATKKTRNSLLEGDIDMNMETNAKTATSASKEEDQAEEEERKMKDKKNILHAADKEHTYVEKDHKGLSVLVSHFLF